jgi:hypothetical protein
MKKYSELVSDDNIPYDIENEPTSSYIEFIEKEKEYLTGDKVEKDNNYWESVFSCRN